MVPWLRNDGEHRSLYALDHIRLPSNESAVYTSLYELYTLYGLLAVKPERMGGRKLRGQRNTLHGGKVTVRVPVDPPVSSSFIDRAIPGWTERYNNGTGGQARLLSFQSSAV